MASLLVQLPEHLSTLQTILLVMVFRNRSRNNLRPVNRIKHVTDTQAGSALGVTTAIDLIKAVDNPALGTANEVAIGCTINGIFISLEVYATTSGALSNVYMTLSKNPGGNLTFNAPNNIGISDNKKYTIHQEMIMLQKVTNSNPRTLFKGVVVIPRGYRRFGPDDRLTMQLLAPGVNVDFCMQSHYKEFR